MDEQPIDDVLAAMEKPLRTAGTDAKSSRNDAAASTVALVATLVSVITRQQRQITELRGRVDALEAANGNEGNLNR